MDEVVAPLLHNKEPVKESAVNVELPQLFTTVTTGADGITFGAATPLPGTLVHPFTVCVTEYVPAVVKVIAEVVAPVLHNKGVLYRDVEITELQYIFYSVSKSAYRQDFVSFLPL